MGEFSLQVERNLKGIECEHMGLLDAAIDLYEQNLDEYFEGSHPYDRLAIIYHKQKEYENERRVLEQAVFVFENIVNPRRVDRNRKLKRFKERLEKINKQR